MGFFSIGAPPSEHIFRFVQVLARQELIMHEKFIQQWQKQVVTTMQIAWQIFLMDVSFLFLNNTNP